MNQYHRKILEALPRFREYATKYAPDDRYLPIAIDVLEGDCQDGGSIPAICRRFGMILGFLAKQESFPLAAEFRQQAISFARLDEEFLIMTEQYQRSKNIS